MRRWIKMTLAILAVLLLAAAVFLIPTIWFKPWSIRHFTTRVFVEFALRRPMLLSHLRILEPLGIDFHNDDLDDFSVAFQRREARRVERNLAILRGYRRDRLSEEDRLSAEVLEWYLVDLQEGNRFLFHDYPVNQTFGVQTSLPDFLINTHQINRPRDARHYVARVAKLETAFRQIREGLRLREEMGILPPRFVLDRVLPQVDEFASKPARENVLFLHFEDALGKIRGLDPGRKKHLAQRLEAAIEKQVRPSYRLLGDQLRSLREKATGDDGVWKLPDGDAYYTHCLKSNTTTDLTPDEVHALGLREGERIQTEMREILRREGLAAEDLAVTMNRLNQDGRFLYPDAEEGRRRILADYQAIIDEIGSRITDLFHLRPRVGVRVEPVPAFVQASAPGAYYQPAPLDGSKPGIFFVNLRSVRDIPRFSMRTLAYHEAIPGHHFQIGVAQGLKDLPLFRRVLPFTAYTEGWALYAEALAAEQGFQKDPYDRLGYLTGQLFRAVRLVVDTGIHFRRWSRERAIEYMLRSTGMPEKEVVTEVERYIVWPGQACAYKIGQLRILELRERARNALGDRFDLREFHDVLLSNGALPLTLLERVVDRWIEAKGKVKP
jgi:uncharacterized protein (DUF885 family)